MAFGVEGGCGSGACGGDGLAVGVVDEVAAGEDAGPVGAGGGGCDDDVSGFVEVDLSEQEFAAGVVADGDEYAVGREGAQVAAGGVA